MAKTFPLRPEKAAPVDFTFSIDDRTFRLTPVEEWTMRQDEHALEFVEEIVPVISGELSAVSTLELMKQLIKARVHTKLLAICYLPLDEKRFDPKTYERRIELMYDAPNAALKEALTRFFTSVKGLQAVGSLTSSLKMKTPSEASPKTSSDS
jgi:hypothetical protein